MKRGKIDQLKDIMSLSAAARYLSSSFDIEMEEVDVLRLALKGKLKLSVSLPDMTAARLISGPSHAEQGEKEVAQKVLICAWVERERIEGEVFFIEGIYDLPMKGGEVLDLKHEVNKLMGVSAQKKIDLGGTLVEDAEGRILQLQEYVGEYQPRPGRPIVAPSFPGLPPSPPYAGQNTSKPFGFLDPPGSETQYIPKRVEMNSGMFWQTDNYIPAGCFPMGSKFLVRTSYLLDLEKNLFPNETGRKSSRKAPEAEIPKDNTRIHEEKAARSKKDFKPLESSEGSAKKTPEKEAATPEVLGNNFPGPVEKGQESATNRGGTSLAKGQDKASAVGSSLEEYLRLPQIIGDPKAGIPPLIPVSKSTWWAGVKTGRYPASVKLSVGCTAWKRSDIEELQERLEATKK